MSTLQTLYQTCLRLLQKLGFSNKTYSLFRKPLKTEAKRKGHLLLNPTDDQIVSINEALLRKTRVDQWRVEDNTDHYSNEWPLRDPDAIDTIVIGSSDSATWNSSTLYNFHTSKKNSITYGTPLPGLATHLFINASGIIERVTSYDKTVWNTRGANTRSIFITLQYAMSLNNATPPKKIMIALEKILTLLCLEFKLNPLKAIKGQHEIYAGKHWFPFYGLLKGDTNMQSTSPGVLISMDNIRREVAIMLKRKLRYAEAYDGPINDVIDKKTAKALNGFNSGALSLIYHTFVKTKITDLRTFNQ